MAGDMERSRLSAFAERSATFGSVVAFFAFKAILGMVLMLVSAKALASAEFATFTQLFLFNAYLSIISSGGVTNGIIRQVAAARSADASEHPVTLAGLLITAGVGTAAALVLLTFGGQLSILLTGDVALASQVRGLGLISLVGGVGQVICATLTGQGRLTRSLATQGVGLLVGSALALWSLIAQQPVAAVFGFASGPLVTTLLVLPAVRKSLTFGTPFHLVLMEVRNQIRFAGAFLVTASVPPCILFGLRQQYRDQWGVQNLGYWLAANRISDLSTQLVGLYATQVFLPALSAATNRAIRLQTIRNAALLTSSLSLMALLVYIAASGLLTTTFLSREFLPAIPLISLYLAGDIGRSMVSTAMISALAHGRAGLYAGIEVATMLAMAAITLGLLAGVPLAPGIGYASAYWTVAVIAAVTWAIAYRTDAASPAKASETIEAAARSTLK